VQIDDIPFSKMPFEMSGLCTAVRLDDSAVDEDLQWGATRRCQDLEDVGPSNETIIERLARTIDIRCVDPATAGSRVVRLSPGTSERAVTSWTRPIQWQFGQAPSGVFGETIPYIVPALPRRSSRERRNTWNWSDPARTRSVNGE
jgi:hypothetical protein